MRHVLACFSMLCVLAMPGHNGSVGSHIGETCDFFPLEREQRPAALTANAAVSSDAAQSLSSAGSPPVSIDTAALQEMLRGSNGQSQHWNRAPELMVLVSVMEYHSGEPSTYIATSEQLTDQEVDELTRDLTAALVWLTGNTYDLFAAIHRESVAAGTSTGVLRPGQIVAGRYRDVQKLVHTIGLGGRASRADGTITGAAILLDNDYDRTSPKRRLLRMHELGHALGYNHVQSQISIMNPNIGPEPTAFDREAAKVAFHSLLAANSN